MVYVYAICESPQSPGVSGLRGAELRTIGEGSHFAIVSEHEDLRLEAAENDLWAHESVIEEAMKEGAVLPMRFGTALADEAAVREALRERGAEFDRALQRVRGAVELAVRAVIGVENLADEQVDAPINVAGPVTQPGPGTAYMLDQLARKRLAERVSERIDRPLAPLARASTSKLSTDEQPRLNAAYLVDRERVAAFRDRVELLEQELDAASIVCTGPWPPYSFVASEPGA
jgi:hypothetical protein